MGTTSLAAAQSLVSSALSRFDQLATEGRLLYEPSNPELVTDRGFKFEFRVAAGLQRKPILGAHDVRRGRPGGPFTHPDPTFVLGYINDTHVLQLNKYCVHRPQLILHTRQFVPQTADLDEADFGAAWDVLRRLESPYVVFYNCGPEAGSSQGHKHLQLFPRPGGDGFVLFPDEPESREALILSQSKNDNRPISPPPSLHVPYKCHLLANPPDDLGTVSPTGLFARYRILLSSFPYSSDDGSTTITTNSSFTTSSSSTTTSTLDEHRQETAAPPSRYPHNLILTRSWMCLIPRRHRGRDGLDIDANAAGMMGLVWVKDGDERARWHRLGPAQHLAWMGFPSLQSDPGPSPDSSPNPLPDPFMQPSG